MARKSIMAAVLACIAMPGASAQSAQDVVAYHNAAYAAGDFAGFMSTFAIDAVVFLDGAVLQGREQISASYSLNFAPGAPQMRVVRQVRAAGGAIAQEEAYVFANGAEICCSLSTFTIREGRIVQVSIDTSRMGRGG